MEQSSFETSIVDAPANDSPQVRDMLAADNDRKLVNVERRDARGTDSRKKIEVDFGLAGCRRNGGSEMHVARVICDQPESPWRG